MDDVDFPLSLQKKTTSISVQITVLQTIQIDLVQIVVIYPYGTSCDS